MLFLRTKQFANNLPHCSENFKYTDIHYGEQEKSIQNTRVVTKLNFNTQIEMCGFTILYNTI